MYIHITICFICLTFSIFLLNKISPHPIFKLFLNWYKWVTFSLIFAFILEEMAWSSRPLWVHLSAGLALWFILETAIYRFSIQMFNLSSIKLFPKYENDTSQNLWPINAQALKIKEWMNIHGFKPRVYLKAKLINDIQIRQAIYLNKDESIQLNVLFIPQKKENIQIYFTFLSKTNLEEYLLTDNQNMPFGGYYPKSWEVCRNPLRTSMDYLFKSHTIKMRQKKHNWRKIKGEDILYDVNQRQKELENINRSLGFMNEPDEREIISNNGCFRVWLEMWLLAYFGGTLS